MGELAAESPRAYLIALRITASPALAEEAVQEAYAKLLQLSLKDEGHAQAVVYFFKTVRGIAINLSRSTRNRKLREDEYAVRRDNAISSAAAISETAEVASAARSALAGLPIEEREAVSLCYEQDMSHATVSKILDVPERTVYHRVERGLEKLRSMLATQGFASLTPLVIGEGLRGLGVPPAPRTDARRWRAGERRRQQGSAGRPYRGESKNGWSSKFRQQSRRGRRSRQRDRGHSGVHVKRSVACCRSGDAGSSSSGVDSGCGSSCAEQDGLGWTGRLLEV